jgi:Phytanoyl-CoA dioxygenase (PhyH)
MEIPYLRGYWQRVLGIAGKTSGEEDLDTTLLCGLRLGLRETLQFLHTNRPSFEEFESWIVERNGGAMDEGFLLRLKRALDGETVGPEVDIDGVEGLSAENLEHWGEHGYVVLKRAVPLKDAKAAELAIYEYLEMDPEQPESWYGGRQGHTIWVAMLRHPAFWANRRSPRMVKAFAQLWGREDLWVNVDQGGLNPPERRGWPFPGPHLHWDTTLGAPHHFGVQGILYLADTAEDQGAFSCVPGFQKRLDVWLESLPKDVDARAEARRTLTMKPIAAEAGDMVLWHQSLPHGSSPNRAKRPRVAQYITMKPTRWDHHQQWL